MKAGTVNVLAAGDSLAGISHAPLRSVATLQDHDIPHSFGVTRGLYVPKDTPEYLRAAASAFVEKAAKSDAFAAFGEKFGFAPIWMSGEEYCALLQSEVETFEGHCQVVFPRFAR